LYKFLVVQNKGKFRRAIPWSKARLSHVDEGVKVAFSVSHCPQNGSWLTGYRSLRDKELVELSERGGK
jgi:hypothetical protein